MNIGVILAAGDGSRFGGYMNKQYLKINGKEMIAYSLFAMRQSANIDKIILVVDTAEYESGYIGAKYGVECIKGGTTRNESIRAAINYIESMRVNCNKIIIHDSARPLVRSFIFENYIAMLDDYDAVVTSNEIVDALTTDRLADVDRSNYKIIQTPEAFKFDKVKEFDAFSSCKSIIGQFPGLKTKLCKPGFINLKVTYPEDLFAAEQLMRLDYYSISQKNNFKVERNPETVLLLGGSGGIGQAIKKSFGLEGIKILAPTHNELDLNNISVDKIKGYLKGENVDAVINAAAVYFDDNDGVTEKFEEIFNINVKSNLILIDFAKTVSHKINLVFFSSSSSTMGRKNLTDYSAAKAALNSIVESMAAALNHTNVFINAVVPEKVNTPLLAKLHKTEINPRELLKPEDVIEAVKYCCVTNESGKLIQIRKGI